MLADARLADSDAVYYPGGDGPMPPVAMMATRRNGASPFSGYRVTAFTNDEEDGVGLRAKARWTAEDELVKMGVDFTHGDMRKPYTVVDRNLFTGQNPASAGPLAREFMKVLE